MSHPMVRYWEYENLEGLYTALIGQDYGQNPLEKIDQIQKDKNFVANFIAELVQVNPSSVGLEIGSGVGFLTKTLAEKSKHLYACDISQSYLEVAKDYCKSLSNITYQRIEPGNLDFLSDVKLDYVFSNNVFIHLNFYEIVNYLQEIRKYLKVGGYLWIDFIEVERVDVLTDRDFLQTFVALKQDPSNRICIQFNSSVAVLNAAERLGFSVENIHRCERCALQLLLKG